MEYRSGKTSVTRTAFYLLRFNVALQIAIAAITINLSLAVATFIYGWNSLYCAFGADSIIGVLTAIILVWRFASSKQEQETCSINIINEDELDPNSNVHPFLRSLESTIENTPDDNRRELWSTFWLGQIMILSGLSVVIRSIVELMHNIIENDHHSAEFFDELLTFDHEQPYTNMTPLYILALISLALNIVLMCFKLFVYYHLESNSMLIEGVNSFISSIFAAMTIISIQFNEKVQYLDQIVSIIFGIFFIVYGIYNVLHTLTQTLIDFIKAKRRRNQYIRLV